MSNFVEDLTDVVKNKENLGPTPGLAKNYINDSDFNDHGQALYDLRGALREARDRVPRKQVNISAFTTALDGSADTIPAFAAAFAAAEVVICDENVALRTDSPLTIPAGKSLLGGSWNTTLIKPNHAGVAVILAGHSNGTQFKNFSIYPDTGAGAGYIGLKLEDQCYCAIVDRIRVYYPTKGVWLFQEANDNILTNLFVWNFHQYGIHLELDSGKVPAANRIHALSLQGDTNLTDTWGVFCDGSENWFDLDIEGQCKYPIECNGFNNRFKGYCENFSPGLGPKFNVGVNYLAMHMATDVPTTVAANARVIGPVGSDVTYEHYLPPRRLSFEGLVGLWLFNEGNGAAYAQDYSGNNHPIPYLAGTAWVTGLWGPAAKIDFSAGHGPGALPVVAADWSQPFTVAMLIRADAYTQELTVMEFSMDPSNNHYTRFANSSFFEVVDYNGSAETQGGSSNVSPYAAGNYRWCVFAVDPANQLIYQLDPFGWRSVQTFPRAFSALPPNTISLGHDVYNGKGITDGSIAYLGIWQRVLDQSEVADLANSPLPLLPSPAAAAHGQRVAPPTNANDPGIVGQWATDSSFYYACTATDTWVRSALATWP